MRTRTDTLPRRIKRPGMFAGDDGSTLSIDFTAMSSLDTRFIFTRSTTATYINSSGVVTSMGAAASNDPTKARFDYDPTTLNARGLLIEGSSTNLLVRSEDMATAIFPGWGVRNNLNTTGWTAQSSPDGASTAVKLIPTTTNATHYLGTGTLSGITSGVEYTISVFVKASGYSVFGIAATNSQSRASFNLSTQSSSSYGIANTRTITAYPNGWYRVTMTWTTSVTSFDVWLFVQNTEQDPVTSWAGDNANSVTVWGAQLELGSGASSYIPTGSSTVQRVADVCTLSSTNFSSWFNNTEGTFLATGERSITSNFGRLLSANANNTTAAFDLGASTSGRWLITNTTSQADITAGTVSANTAFKVAGAFANNDAQMSFNGTLGTADTSVSLPTASQLDIGADRTAVYLNGRVRSIKFWPTRLPNATLQSLTA